MTLPESCSSTGWAGGTLGASGTVKGSGSRTGTAKTVISSARTGLWAWGGAAVEDCENECTKATRTTFNSSCFLWVVARRHQMVGEIGMKDDSRQIPSGGTMIYPGNGMEVQIMPDYNKVYQGRAARRNPTTLNGAERLINIPSIREMSPRW